jgi:gamma-glutamyltranspeptidase/glutathione hydrolase
MVRGGGLITLDDLVGYTAKPRKPIHGEFRGYDIYGPPPPSSGGTALVEMLNLVEVINLRQYPRWSPTALHLMTESMKRAYCDRARYLGDPDFIEVPKHLTEKGYARKLAAGISLDKATPSETLAPEIQLAGESEQTTHFSVVDASGMAVSNTYTLEYSFGSKIVVQGAGFLLNNELGDFNPKPGVTNRAGKIGTAANEVRPGKRPLSSMTPTIVAKNGKPILVTGSPGGRTIINTVFCVVVNKLEYDLPLQESVEAMRMHHQWLPDRLNLEGTRLDGHTNVVDALKRMGHDVNIRDSNQGDAHSIWIDPKTGQREGVSDPRRDGWAAGE